MNLILPEQSEQWTSVALHIHDQFQNWRRRRRALFQLKYDGLSLERRYPPHIWKRVSEEFLPSICYDNWDKCRQLYQAIEQEHDIWNLKRMRDQR